MRLLSSARRSWTIPRLPMVCDPDGWPPGGAQARTTLPRRLLCDIA